MKKLSILFSIFAVLMAVTFTSCSENVGMEPLEEYMIGDWMIGEWEFESGEKTVGTGNPNIQTIKRLYEIEGTEYDSRVIYTDDEEEDDEDEDYYYNDDYYYDDYEKKIEMTFNDVRKSLFPFNEEFKFDEAEMEYSLEVNASRTKIIYHYYNQKEELGDRIVEKEVISIWTKR